MSNDFIITALILIATPGTGAIYTVAAGLSRGPFAALWAAFASTLGIVPHVAAAMLGLATLLHTSALAFELVKYAGVAYLLYMAWQSWHARGSVALKADQPKVGPLKMLADGVVLNLLNPKLSIFFVAFLPQFIKPDEAEPLMRMGELSIAFMALTFLVFMLYGLCASGMRVYVFERPSILTMMQKGFALAFGAMAAKLALQQR